MRIEQPFHEGELAIQRRVGDVDEGRRNGRAIADEILRGALKFVGEQRLVVLGSVDRDGGTWASMLLGRRGFAQAPDTKHVSIDLQAAFPLADDPLWRNLDATRRVGLLFIEPSTRRRLRINGTVSVLTPQHVVVNVSEAYPNCPKYIQRRRPTGERERPANEMSPPRSGVPLEGDHARLITAADTFFVASAHPDRGADVSHRGGDPGFVDVLNERTLRIPDYVGNSMYNTLGNFEVNPRAGLVFFDFTNGRSLQVVGRPTIRWDLEDAANRTGGTRRFWDFSLDRWIELTHPVRFDWELLEYSPHDPRAEAASRAETHGS